MDIQTLVQTILSWVDANYVVIGLAVGALLALLMMQVVIRTSHRYFSKDRAELVFRRARLRVPAVKVEELRAEFVRAAVDTERQRVNAENKQHIELASIEAEKSRILRLVRSTPAVVREAGEALKAIEREYDQGVRALRSEQTHEVLRRTAEKQIREVLRTVSDDGKNLPLFSMGDTSHGQATQPHLINTESNLLSR